MESCVVADEFAIFVSPTGSEDGDGSKSAPVASIAAAIALAGDQGKVVVACSTDDAFFTAPLELSGEINARVYGGFKCSDWTWSATRTKVMPESGVALKLEGVSGGLHVEDFEFRANDATEAGESSIGAIVSNTQDVSLVRVTIAAGNGADGERGGWGGDCGLRGAGSGGPQGGG
jgi:hypothetical protein